MAILAGDIMLDVARVLFESDITFSSGLFTPAEILGYINQVQNDFLTKAPVVYNSAFVSLSPNTQIYTQPDNALWMERLAIAGKSLLNTSQASLDLYESAWVSSQPTATPSKWYQDQTAVNQYGIAPPPMPFLTAITDATNLTPIEITTTDPHGRVTGQQVIVSAILGNTAANNDATNPVWTVTVTGLSSLQLNGSVGNGSYVSGGVLTIPNEVWFSEKVSADSAPDTPLLVPFLFSPAIKYGVLQRCFDKDGEQRDPDRAKLCGMLYDFWVMLAQRFLDWSKTDSRIASKMTVVNNFPVPAVVKA